MVDENKRIKILDRYPGTIGTSTNPSNPNQLLETEQKIWEGFPQVEIQAINTQVWQTIPKQLFDNIAAKAKLTGTQISIHAPIQDLDLSGIDPNRGEISEEQRKLYEYRLKKVLDAAAEIGEKLKYNVPVNVHVSVTGARKWDKQWEEEIKNTLRDKYKELKPWERAKAELAYFVPEGKPIQYIEAEKLQTPFGYEIKTIKDKVEELNKLTWSRYLGESRRILDSLKSHLQWVAEHGGEALYDPAKAGKFYNALQYIEYYYSLVEDQIKRMYEWTEKYGTEKHKQALEELKKKLNELNRIRKKIAEYEKEIQRTSQAINQPVEKYREFAKYVFNNLLNLQYYRFKLLEEIENTLGKATALYGPPKIIKTASELVLEKGPRTVGEAMAEYIAKYHDKEYKIPKLVIENVYPEFNLSRAEELAMFIEKAREETIKQLKEKHPEIFKKLGEKKVKELVNKLIGATWDVGHIYKLKSMGYSDKEILEETKKIAPYVKHVHITDNYGDYDVHLIPGQGEVKINEMLKILKEAKEKAEEEGMFLITEAGGWYTGRFADTYKEGVLPLLYELSDVKLPIESPIYPMKISYSEIANIYDISSSGMSQYFPYVGEPTMSYLNYIHPMLPAYIIPTATVTQYHPLGTGTFSNLPTDLGGTSPRQTFSGKSLE